MFRKFLLLVSVAAGLASCTTNLELPANLSYKLEANVFTLSNDSATYQVKVLSDNIIHITYSDSLTYSNRTYAPILTRAKKFKLTQSDSVLQLITSTTTVNIQLDPVRFSFYDNKSGLKLAEKEGYNRVADSTSFSFKLKSNEAIYGTGSRSIPLNRRGYKFQCYNQANYGYGENADFLNYSAPVFMSSEKYMVLIDNPARAWFDIGKTTANENKFTSLGGNMSYYFINGNNYKDVLKNYAKLTGTQPMPPIWAFGNLQSRFGYKSQDETSLVVDSMLKSGYPLDAIIIDIYWFGEEMQDGYMGNLSWDKKNWPNPDKMIADFAAKGVKTITVSEPFFTRKSQHFDYLDKNKLLGCSPDGETMSLPYFYFGDAGLLDIFNPEARDWLWKQYKKEKERGIAGWWGDLGEPEVHPDTMLHVNGFAREVHGVYGHEWVKLFYKNYAKDYPDERLFKLGRAGFAGSQRYGLIPWSGDVGRTWSGLRAQNNVMLGMGQSGLPYMHSDAGGFAWYPRDSLVYMRWMQYAVFTPIYRPHSDYHAPAEPVFYHPEVQKRVKPSIKLRYRMLPYNYTLAWETEQSGYPMAVPMFMAFEDENISDTLSDQYMWGESILVAPVMYPHATKRDIYFPETTWYNLYTDEKIESTGFTQIEVTDTVVPAFAKGGSFIPFISDIQNTGEYDADTLFVSCFLSDTEKSFDGKVYIDNGALKNAYRKEEYELIYFHCEGNDDELILNIYRDGDYAENIEQRVLNIKIVGLAVDFPTVKLGNGEAATITNNTFSVVLNKNEKINVSIK